MSKKTVHVIFYLLIGALFIFATVGCPGETEDPKPSGPDPTPTVENGDPTPPIEEPTPPIEEPTLTFKGPLEETIVIFFDAMSESDFDKARDACTEDCWNENFEEFLEMMETFSEEEKAKMMADFKMDEEQYRDLEKAVSEITGDTATLTITDDDGVITIFGFAKEDGRWKIDSLE